jgi:hypothetical protein
MKVARAVTLAAVFLVASACYHQVVRTGKAPGTTVIEKSWTPTWIFGLVPATPIDVTQQCRSGVAIVETQQTVPNILVGIVTLGIYTPVSVKVTCASGSASLPGAPTFHVAQRASQTEVDAVFAAAAAESQRTGQAVVVRF